MNTLTRRDVFRGLGLSVLAIGAVGLLDGCGDDVPGGSGGSTDLTLASSDVERSDADPAAVADGVSSMHALGAGLWAELSGQGGNLAISPFSVAVALGMTLNGAKGATLDEMLDVLAVDSADSANAGYNAVTQHIESLAGPVGEDQEIVLDAANALFGQQGMAWEEPFLDTLAASYGAGMQQVDYATATEAARKAINGWTAERTRDKIPELIPGGVLNDLTRLVLVNALYLKAPWALPFEKEMTKDGDFHLADGSTVSVPMMRAVEGVTGASGEGWRSARISYAGGALAMTVVLPDGDLDALVSEGTLADVLAAEPTGAVDLTMPRWTFRSPSPLAEALKALGMPTAFDDGAADFSAMTHEAELFVAAVLHEVFIAVDEEGTEAAAATAVVMQDKSASMPGEPLVLDRPFVFIIHDVEHGTPLFVGRVADPS